ncbi:MAG: hypothetical protein Q8M84_05270 [Thiobacillus sp.]|nr:hypothetical protein [Thiobacillus sp.]
MLIDHVFPVVIAEKSTLRDRLLAEGAAVGLTPEQTAQFVALVPEPLISTGAFLDKLTGLWRYEFGVPFDITNNQYWGTHMWVPVMHLFMALRCANDRLPEVKRIDYLARLADAEKHQAILVEMIPAQKVDPTMPLEFEVAGRGVGNRTVDWVIQGYGGRTVLLDVKRRTIDFIAQAEEMATDSSKQEPIHDPALLFRSVEKKFLPADPLTRLQGAWICTDIKQNEEKLSQAFAAMSADRVHFAILGDWENDACVLARRPEDLAFIFDLFRIVPSKRFTFRCGHEG